VSEGCDLPGAGGAVGERFREKKKMLTEIMISHHLSAKGIFSEGDRRGQDTQDRKEGQEN